MSGTRIDWDQPSRPVYTGLSESGQELRFTDIVFHGGEGETLEHRIYNVESFSQELMNAGFSQAYPLMRNHPRFGASWEPWSRVWIAIK